MNIITPAFDMAEAVEAFMQKAKKSFCSVMLLGHRCPKCNGSLVMANEGKCRCVSCKKELDPTVAFQRCSECGGVSVSVIKARRYECKYCGSDIQSRFLFDGLAFDADSFRQMLAESRSADLPLGAVDLAGVPGLLDALNNLTAGLDITPVIGTRDECDLKRYEKHIKAHI